MQSETETIGATRIRESAQSVTVTVVVPMRNEERHIEACLHSLLNQTFPPAQYEIVVADGCSTDNSSHIVEGMRAGSVRIRLLTNRSKHTPAGMNLGIKSATGNIVVIAGAHTLYPPEFIENCILWMNKTEADVVGGPVKIASVRGGLGVRVASLILTSRFGVGNSRFRVSSDAEYVDSVPFGAYRKSIFDRIGLFNERLTRNQDNDLSARIRHVGGRIFLTPALTTTYIPTTGFIDLLRQAFTKSQWHMLTLYENVRALGIRHLTPAIFVIVLIFLSIASGWSLVAKVLLVTIALSYLLVGEWFALDPTLGSSTLLRLALPFACLPFHLAYGLGTLLGVRRLIFRTASGRTT